MATTSWLIGSRPNLAAQTLTIEGAPHVITAGSRYLYASSSALSIIARVEAAMDAAGVTGAAVYLTKARKVRITASGTFTLNWPADGVLRDLLGFNGNLAAASSYVATYVSPLLWSPLKPESPEDAPLGVVGHKVHNAYFSQSPHDGTTSAVIHGSRTYNVFRWGHVPIDRVQTSNGAGGEWATFWDSVVVLGSRFFHFRCDEDVAGTSTAEAAITVPLGPYVLRAPGRGVPDWDFQRSRGLTNVDRRCDVVLPVSLAPEYT
jgi:hypothetical protein